jgi:hypothetical protein
MISQVTGRLVTRDVEHVEITTAGGVTYELSIPLGTFEALPPRGEAVALFTHLVVRDDEWALYGFSSAKELAVFRRLLAATGVGPALALGMLSRFSADRLVRAIREKDIDTLQSVPRVGRKKAQRSSSTSPTSWMISRATARPARLLQRQGPIMRSGPWYHWAWRRSKPRRPSARRWRPVVEQVTWQV